MDRECARVKCVLLGCGLAMASCVWSFASGWESKNRPAIVLPDSLGSWELVETGRLDEGEAAMLQARDHWRRVYQCRATDQRLMVTMVEGASGPLVCHQPEVCYARDEFGARSDSRLWSVPESRDQFRIQTFEPRDVQHPSMTVCYAWHDGDRWRAPGTPRLRLAGRSTLRRLQISMRHPSGRAEQASSAIKQFLMATVKDQHKQASPMVVHALEMKEAVRLE